MKKILFHIPAALCLAIVFALAACEQPVTGDVDDTKGEEQLSEGDINVKFNVCNLEMMPAGLLTSVRLALVLSLPCSRETAVWQL